MSVASSMSNGLKKTRFVCISDTHNLTFKLPPGDVLIHAGDLTKQGTYAELKKTVDWIEKSDFEVKIVVAGNHDITLDRTFYVEHGPNFHSQTPQDAEACVDLLRKSESITYLEHKSKDIHLTKATGPQTKFKVFGSPFSPAKGTWAFQYSPERRFDGYDQIPLDADIVITHTPPKFHCDESEDNESSGCEALREVLWRVRPKLALCGHVHEARGAELVTWDLGNPNITFKEESTTYWEDTSEGTKKQALVDLTAKGGNLLASSDGAENLVDGKLGANGIANDKTPRKVKTCSTFSLSKPVRNLPTLQHTRSAPKGHVETSKQDSPMHSTSSPPSNPSNTSPHNKTLILKRVSLTNLRRSTSPKDSSRSRSPPSSLAPPKHPNISPEIGASRSVHQVGTAVRGRGGSPSSRRSDREALSGRLGRRQTCVINAAIMATSWPYKGAGGERYNKPIVVDVDLPIANSSASP